MKKNLILTILSGILTIFIWHNFGIHGNNVIFLFIFISGIFVMQQILKNTDKRKMLISSIISIAFAIVEVVVNSINTDYTLNHIINKWLPINILGYYSMAMIIVHLVFSFFDYCSNIKEKEISKKDNIIIKFLSNSKVSFIVCVILIFIAWLPYFLRYYPGIVTPDSCWQIEMAIGTSKLSNHHPITHTAIIAIFVNLGLKLFHNINTGIALYTLASMLLMAIIDACVLKYLKNNGTSKIVRVIILLYYMFYPVNAMYSITMWKDVLFSGVIPLLIIMYKELVFNTDKFFSKKSNIALYIIISMLTILLRHNGLYAVILSMPFIIIALRKYWKKTVSLFLSVIVLYMLSNVLIYNILNITKGSVSEMLSIPVQQIARVEKNHREELGEDTLNTINKFFNVKNIGDNYNPILSDPVKFKFNVEYFNENKLQFIKLWLQLLAQYPKEYVESFISNSYGYYYVEAENGAIFTVTMDDQDAPMGIEQTPIINSRLVDFATTLVDSKDEVLITMFFSLGLAFWVLVTCLAYKIYLKEYKNILIYLPIFILWLTMIASPVFCEFRYAYPIFTTLPLYIALNFKKKGE